MRLLVNVQDIVRVRLTERGLKVLNDFYRNDPMRFPTTDPDQQVELCGLMRVFGPHMVVGSSPLFENNEVEVSLR